MRTTAAAACSFFRGNRESARLASPTSSRPRLPRAGCVSRGADAGKVEGRPRTGRVVDIVRSLVFELGRAKPPQTPIAPEIGQLIPELSSETMRQRISSEPEHARFRLFDAVATLLKQVARAGPLVLILDDLHEADRSSLELLKFVARGLTDSRIIIVGTHRDAEVRRSHDFAESISEILRHGNPMPLFGLDESEVTQMIEHHAERTPSATFASELHRVTAGNPLFVDGVIRVLVAERKLGTAEHLDLSGFKVPEGVLGAIRKRLAMLTAEAQSALAIAAVIGAEFDSVLLQRVSKLSAGPLAELIREASDVGIVAAASRESYRFTHPLIREALYNETADSERVRLHRATGEALEQMHATNLTPDLAALAHHFGEAGVVEKAIDYSVRAGNAAYAVFAYEEAATHWRAALELMDEQGGGDRERRAGILWRLGDELISSGPKAIEYLEAAAPLYEELGDKRRASDAHSRLGLYLCAPNLDAMDMRRAMDHFKKAEAQLAEQTESWRHAVFYIGMAAACGWAERIGDGLAAAKRTWGIGERLGVDLLRAYGEILSSMSLVVSGSVTEGLRLANQARQRAEPINHTMLGSTVAWVGGRNYLLLGDPREAQDWYTHELAKPRTAHSAIRRVLLLHLLTAACIQGGELAKARSYLAEANAANTPAGLLFFEGEWERADKMLSAWSEHSRRTGNRREELWSAIALARLHRVTGEHAWALQFLEKALDISVEGGDILQELATRATLATIATDADESSEALPHLERCREIMAAGEDWRGLAGYVARAEAVLAVVFGSHHEAERQFGKAIDVFRRYTLRWEEAETLLYWGRALNTAHDSRANEKFNAAIALYRSHGAGQRWIDRVEDARPTRSLRSVALSENGKPRAIFRREGEFWTIVWHGKTSRLKDAKGLRYIAYLLAHPGDQIHVHDLIIVVEGSAVDRQSHAAAHSDGLEIVRDIGGRDSALDSRARSEYGARLRELRTELDEAERFNDTGRRERLRAEIELVSDELTAAGLGRRASSDNAERARGMVSKRIRATLDKLCDEDPVLGRHFNASIKTGYFCAYLPDPDHKIAWQM